MIQVRLLITRAPTENGLEQHQHDTVAWLSPSRIDTITAIESAEMRKQQHLHPDVRAVIRYDDPRTGFRLLYVADDAADLVRRRRREMRGEDSDTPDWGGTEPA
jgi:hypothetical protein